MRWASAWRSELNGAIAGLVLYSVLRVTGIGILAGVVASLLIARVLKSQFNAAGKTMWSLLPEQRRSSPQSRLQRRCVLRFGPRESIPCRH
ncbi:MAG TPA: hypothetical protein VFA04_18795 [Bryobacteraceae bacterium]|nr:hypothetical protein [Bryobacteraceae bacterium]